MAFREKVRKLMYVFLSKANLLMYRLRVTIRRYYVKDNIRVTYEELRVNTFVKKQER